MGSIIPKNMVYVKKEIASDNLPLQAKTNVILGPSLNAPMTQEATYLFEQAYISDRIDTRHLVLSMKVRRP